MRHLGERDERSVAALARAARLTTFVVVAVGAVLRLTAPDEWWLNPDEGIYYAAVTRTRFTDFWADAMATAHPPLYFLLLRALALVGTDFGWLRSVAFVAGVAAVYAFVLLGREVAGGGKRGLVAGLTAGLLLAVSPRAIAVSQVIRPYALLTLLLAVTLYCLLRSLRQGSRWLLLAYALCASIAVTLHYSAVLALGVFGALVLADGVTSGFRRAEWRRLAYLQLVPALTLLVVYVWHLRKLAASDVADDALGGWLASYMVRSPVEVWLGIVGAHSSLVGDPLAAGASLLTLACLVWAARARKWPVVVMGVAALALAALAAALEAYPMGATRHASWLLVFLTPVLAWGLGSALTLPSRGRALALVGAVALLGGARAMGPVLDPDRRPREISERVLQTEHVRAMAESLDPESGPRLVLMSTETYMLLTPLYVAERESAERSLDLSLLGFRWGRREVVVISDRDFTVLAGEMGRDNHLVTAVRRASEQLGVRLPAEGESILVLAGGWRSQAIEDLVALARASPGLGTSTHVPGLIAVALDFSAYRRALGLGASRRGSGSPAIQPFAAGASPRSHARSGADRPR